MEKGGFTGVVGGRTARKIKALKLLSDPSLTPKMFSKLMGYNTINSAYKAISRLVKDGYLTTDSTPITRTLTQAGKNLIIQVDKLGYTPLDLSTILSTTKTVKPDLVRLHALQFSLTPVSLEGWDSRRFLGEIQVRQYGATNYREYGEQSKITDFWVDTLRIVTNARGVELYLPDLIAQDTRTMIDTAFKQVIDAMPTLEKIFKVQFYKPNTLKARLAKQEIAVLNNETAAIFAQAGLTSLHIYDHEGIEWATLDYSKGKQYPEWEFKATKTADFDIARFKQFMNEQRDPGTFLPAESSKLIRKLEETVLEVRALTVAVTELSTELGKIATRHEKRLENLESKGVGYL